MKAFHGKQEIKDFYIEKMKAHMAADELVRGHYWDPRTRTGCGVGCILEVPNGENIHKQFEPELEIPCQVAYLVDYLFEKTPIDYYLAFPLAFLEATPVAADLSKVTSRFLVWLLLDGQDGIIRFADPLGKEVVILIAGLYQRLLDGGEVADSEWAAASVAASVAARTAACAADRTAARAAARDAASVADSVADSDTAWDAAWYAASAAARTASRAAASPAARAAVRDAAWEAATKRQAEKLLELLREAPVPVEVGSPERKQK